MMSQIRTGNERFIFLKKSNSIEIIRYAFPHSTHLIISFNIESSALSIVFGRDFASRVILYSFTSGSCQAYPCFNASSFEYCLFKIQYDFFFSPIHPKRSEEERHSMEYSKSLHPGQHSQQNLKL